MINYNKNELINECLTEYYETFAHTLDTVDYVPEKYNNKILAYVFKCMKKQFKKIDREDKRYQKTLKQGKPGFFFRRFFRRKPAPCEPSAETEVRHDEQE